MEVSHSYELFFLDARLRHLPHQELHSASGGYTALEDDDKKIGQIDCCCEEQGCEDEVALPGLDHHAQEQGGYGHLECGHGNDVEGFCNHESAVHEVYVVGPEEDVTLCGAGADATCNTVDCEEDLFKFLSAPSSEART